MDMAVRSVLALSLRMGSVDGLCVLVGLCLKRSGTFGMLEVTVTGYGFLTFLGPYQWFVICQVVGRALTCVGERHGR